MKLQKKRCSQHDTTIENERQTQDKIISKLHFVQEIVSYKYV